MSNLFSSTAMNRFTVVPLRCANQTVTESCKLEGLFACKNCKLVSYCGLACQKFHWSSHKVECRDPLNKTRWIPEWDRTNRTPAWATGEAPQNLHNPFGSSKYLWGNAPAIDIAQMAQNEGKTYDRDITLLFAASGDLRNMIKTLRSLSESFSQHVDVTVNDWEFDVVARNTITLLLIFASLDDISSDPTSYGPVAEALIHVWYSAFITQTLLSSLQDKVAALLQNSCTHSTELTSGGMVKKTWSFPRDKALSITLRAHQWPQIEKFLEVPTALTREYAKEIRAAVVMSPERADYRDRWYYKDAYPSMRLAKRKFRIDGLLLPFGHPRTDFNVPNPTMFQSDCWPFDDKSDPMAGWSIIEVYETPWAASQDTYGKLFAYLRKEFQAFFHRMVSLKIRIQLLNADAKLLPELLTPKSYGRIEVSNISDAGYVGTRRTLSLYAPLLQPRAQNPHATIITCYLNAVMEVAKMTNMENTMPDVDFLAQYLPETLDIFKMMRQGADFYKAWDCRTLALDVEYYFNLYIEIQGFKSAAEDAGLVMKKKNTIVESWPLRLKARPGDVGAQKEFDLLLSSSSSGIERYVEWSIEEQPTKRSSKKTKGLRV